MAEGPYSDEPDWTEADFDRADRIVKRVIVSCCIGGAAIVLGVTKWAGLW